MPGYTVVCTVCGNSFPAVTKNKKYCSPSCRAAGAKRVREEWEQNSDYKVKQRQRMREKRKQEQATTQQQRQMHRIKTNEVLQRELECRKKQHLEETKKKVAQGDLNALQDLAFEKGDILEYWRLYKEQILESEREFNYVGRHLIGGIEVHEENFEYLVVEQIEDKKDCNE
ncbi:hypothetical protein P7H01_05440 [Enterococcus thailandicus]|uniref:hypothetical protein n=1 Tax=Enterococcus thailandicus TaxID=417368 RepID=UPI00288FE98C|nr:hypothetical protein [Enterococcus thailandicus]MDT2751500.1 hypothetical protein [Enterococcus thailandicus]